MDLAAFLQPRDRPATKRAAAALMLAAAALLTVFNVAEPPHALAVRALSWAVPIILVAMTVLLFTLGERWLGPLWLGAPVLGVIAITGLDLATRDASAGAQVFFCYPVLYAASLLQAPAAGFIAAFAVGGDAVVAFALQPGSLALTSLANVGGTLVAMTALLALSGNRHDRLVALLSRQATVDPLTGLATRRVLDDATAAALEGGSEAAYSLGSALLLVDVDRFKSINDTHGHLVGDQALVHISATLGAHCRPGDVVCRIGGDEIAVLLPHCGEQAAFARAEQFVTAIRDNPLPLPQGGRLALSASVGAAHARSDRLLTPDELYAAADAALYEAKRAGRDRAYARSA